MHELPWFCAITNPNCQARAALELHSLGYRTFYPKLKRWVTHARVRKAKERPLLGRYIFVEVGPDQSFGEVRRANGIESLVGIAGEPASIDWHVVNSFRMRQMAGEWDFTSKEKFPVGARVKIIEGEFNEYLATVTGRSKGKLGVKILGTNISRSIYEHSARAA